MSSVVGVLTLSRHGDRQGFYQSPTTYTAVQTNLTVLGYVQELQNGADLRARYLAGGTNTPTTSIAGIDILKAENAQLAVIADAGGEGGVIVESAAAALQGLYPAFEDTLALANGTTVSWNRAQLIPIESLEVSETYYMEGYTGCNAFTTRLNNWYASPAFRAQAELANAFYASASIAPLLGNRAANLENAWNLFDFLNVQSIHNASFAQALPPTALAQARYWADYHEAGSFSDPDLSNVGNIAGQAILPLILDSLHDLANTSSPTKMVTLFGAYKPFLSLFELMDIGGGLPRGSVVEYASTLILEVHADQSVHLLFRNGTNTPFTPYPFLGASSPDAGVPLSSLTAQLEPYALRSNADWCNKCASTASLHGCDVLAALNGTGGGQVRYAPITSTSGRQRVSPVVAGVIGSVVTLALCTLLFVVAILIASRPGEGGKHRRRRSSVRPISTASSRPARWCEQRGDQLQDVGEGPRRVRGSEEEDSAAPYELGRRANLSGETDEYTSTSAGLSSDAK
ncbi:hypothetical protein OC835_001711 [Tilletia horrida]|nr:hypothetical protein OC835_001711 [Tilletia horrida]